MKKFSDWLENAIQKPRHFTAAVGCFVFVCIFVICLWAIAGGTKATTDETEAEADNNKTISEIDSGIAGYFKQKSAILSGTLEEDNEAEETAENTSKAEETAASETDQNAEFLEVLKDILITNEDNTEKFTFEELFQEDNTRAKITKSEKTDSPRIVLYCEKNGAYCENIEQRTIANFKTITTVDNSNCVLERARLLEKIAENKGVGVALCTSETRGEAEAEYVAKSCGGSCELTVNLINMSFTYPEGSRYFATKTTAEGKSYAKIKIIITGYVDPAKVTPEPTTTATATALATPTAEPKEIDANLWKQNAKLAAEIIYAAEKKLPGIIDCIETRADEKYSQDFTTYGITIVLGYEGNTTEEADNTAELLGEILAELYG